MIWVGAASMPTLPRATGGGSKSVFRLSTGPVMYLVLMANAVTPQCKGIVKALPGSQAGLCHRASMLP